MRWLTVSRLGAEETFRWMEVANGSNRSSIEVNRLGIFQIIFWGHRNRAWKLRGLGRQVTWDFLDDVWWKVETERLRLDICLPESGNLRSAQKTQFHVDVNFCWADICVEGWIFPHAPIPEESFLFSKTEEVHFSCGHLELRKADHSRTLWEVDWPKAGWPVGCPCWSFWRCLESNFHWTHNFRTGTLQKKMMWDPAMISQETSQQRMNQKNQKTTATSWKQKHQKHPILHSIRMWRFWSLFFLLFFSNLWGTIGPLDHWTWTSQVGRSSERYGTTESTEKRPKGQLLELKHLGLDRNCIIERGWY